MCEGEPSGFSFASKIIGFMNPFGFISRIQLVKKFF